MPNKIEISDLAVIVHQCFVNSGDNLHFNEDQCNDWLIRGMTFKGYLSSFLGATFDENLTSEVQTANNQLNAIKGKIDDAQQVLQNYNQIINELISLTEILTKLIRLASLG